MFGQLLWKLPSKTTGKVWGLCGLPGGLTCTGSSMRLPRRLLFTDSEETFLGIERGGPIGKKFFGLQDLYKTSLKVLDLPAPTSISVPVW